MAQIELELKAKHFKNSEFVSNTDCPVARATREQLGTTVAQVSTISVKTDNDNFLISYWAHQYRADADMAFSNGFDDSVVRVLILEN